MGNVKKLIIATVSIIILFGGVFLTKYLSDIKKYKEIVRGISISNIDLSKVKDGSYIGDFDAILVGAEVNVTVQNQKIVDIQLVKHKNEKGKNAEIIPDKVMQAQSLQVDAVSDATNSSKVILKAIENALKDSENKAWMNS